MQGIAPGHVVAWAEKIQANLEQFKRNKGKLSNQEKIEFIRQQYYLLQKLVDAVDGRVRFVGAYHGKGT